MKKLLPLRSLIPVLVMTVLYGLAFTFVGTVGGDDDSAHISEGSVKISNEYYAGNVKINTPVLTTTAPEQDYAEYVVMTWNKSYADDDLFKALVTTTAAPTATETQTTTTAVTTSVVSTQAAPEITTTAPTQSSPVEDTSTADAPSIYGAGFTFKTYGYGHGCGLSQNGANYFAIYGGYDYAQILAHFYPGATLADTGITGDEIITVNGVSGRVIDIISMVCNQEVGPSFHPEAIKAQAVAAYTFVMYNGGSTSGLGMRANPPESIVNCVTEVLGQALFYDGKYILSQFYASSGGASASCKDIFTSDLPYLRSVECPYDELYDPHYGTETTFTAEHVKSVLEAKLGITLSSDPANWITFTEGDGGYIASVNIDNQVTVKGQRFRSFFGLKSANMEVFYTPADQNTAQ